jgi:hypothetical protein
MAKYKVKKGDTYFSIAQSTLGNTSRVNELMRQNRDIKVLSPGVLIDLPDMGGGTSTTAAPAWMKKTAQFVSKYGTPKSKINPSGWADKLGVTVQAAGKPVRSQQQDWVRRILNLAQGAAGNVPQGQGGITGRITRFLGRAGAAGATATTPGVRSQTRQQKAKLNKNQQIGVYIIPENPYAAPGISYGGGGGYGGSGGGGGGEQAQGQYIRPNYNQEQPLYGDAIGLTHWRI